jgi:hypothetical protein
MRGVNDGILKLASRNSDGKNNGRSWNAFGNTLNGTFPVEGCVWNENGSGYIGQVFRPRVVIQWDTFRRIRSAGTNISQAGFGELLNRVGAFESNKLWISKVVTHQFWFEQFMLRLHKRVRTVRRPDTDFPIDVMHVIDTILEQEWLKCVGLGDQKCVAEMGAWFLGGFCTGL